MKEVLPSSPLSPEAFTALKSREVREREKLRGWRFFEESLALGDSAKERKKGQKGEMDRE